MYKDNKVLINESISADEANVPSGGMTTNQDIHEHQITPIHILVSDYKIL